MGRIVKAGSDPSGSANSVAMADLDEAVPQVVHTDEFRGLSAKLSSGTALKELRSIAAIVVTFAADR
jgi:hypothetical protein